MKLGKENGQCSKNQVMLLIPASLCEGGQLRLAAGGSKTLAMPGTPRAINYEGKSGK